MLQKATLLVVLFISQLALAQKVTFKITDTKVKTDNIGALTLHVDVINKSNKAVTILLPATNHDQKWMYYSANIQCNSPSIWDAGATREQTDYNEADLLVIPAKSTKQIVVGGRNNTNSLSCNSSKASVKLVYNPSKLFEEMDRDLNAAEIEVIKKLTPIKIESEMVNLELL